MRKIISFLIILVSTYSFSQVKESLYSVLNYASIPVFFDTPSEIIIYLDKNDFKVIEFIEAKENTLGVVIFKNSKTNKVLAYHLNTTNHSLVNPLVYYFGTDKMELESFLDTMRNDGYEKEDERIVGNNFVTSYIKNYKFEDIRQIVKLYMLPQKNGNKYFVLIDGYHPGIFLKRFKEYE